MCLAESAPPMPCICIKQEAVGPINYGDLTEMRAVNTHGRIWIPVRENEWVIALLALQPSPVE